MDDRIPSPCKSICKIGKDNYCIGCYRHMDEIRNWAGYNHNEKLFVLEMIRERKSLKTKVKRLIKDTKSVILGLLKRN